MDDDDLCVQGVHMVVVGRELLPAFLGNILIPTPPGAAVEQSGRPRMEQPER